MNKSFVLALVLGLVMVWSFAVQAEPVYCPFGDWDRDCDVDFNDLRLFAAVWLNDVNVIDFTKFAEDWQQIVGPAIISEFMASNDDTLLDGDGASSDWIEIYNLTDQTLDLQGWYLTDKIDNLTK